MPAKLSPSVFLNKALNKNGNKIIYNMHSYANTSTEINMYCTEKEHDFWQTPEKHLLAKHACPICARKQVGYDKALTTEGFIERAVAVHGNKFDYSLVVYVNNETKVDVKCNACQKVFQCHPNNHTSNKRGCPMCAKTGYDPSKAGTLYIMRCFGVTKVGITNLTSETRRRDISRSYGEDFVILREWKSVDGKFVDYVETSILRELRKQYKQVAKKFDGSSECFLDVNLQELIANINKEFDKE